MSSRPHSETAGWPCSAAGDEARLLWYANHAHGSGPAYTVVTVTAIRDGAAWERLARRIQRGDLRQWMRELDELRHDVDAKLLVALPWSPLLDVSFDEVPVDGREHELTLYMEDTMWPYEDKFAEYIDRCGEVYAKGLERPASMLTIQAALPAGSGQSPAPRSGADAAHSPAGSAAQPPSDRDSSRTTVHREPGCTTHWTCATNGPAGCCAPPRGHPCIEPRMNIGMIIDGAATGDPDRVALIIDKRRHRLRPAGSGCRTLRRRSGCQWCGDREPASPSSTAAACFPSHRFSARRASVQRQR